MLVMITPMLDLLTQAKNFYNASCATYDTYLNLQKKLKRRDVDWGKLTLFKRVFLVIT